MNPPETPTSAKGQLLADLRRMAPVWGIVFLAAAGSLAAIRTSGVRYLEAGIHSQGDSCKVAEIHFQRALGTWRELARTAHGNLEVERERDGAASASGLLAGEEKLAGTREALEEVLRLCPSFVGAHELLADLAAWEGDQAEVHYQLGMEHLQAGEYDAARVEFEAARDQAPERDRVQIALLDTTIRQERWEDVRLTLDNAPDAIRDSATGYWARGKLAALDKNNEKAIESFKKALEKRPGQPAWTKDLFHLLWAKGQFVEGGEWILANAEKAQAPGADPYYSASTLFYQADQYDRAAEALGKALDIQPNNILLLLDKALCQYHLGNMQEAKATIERAFNLNPREYMRIIEEKRFGPLRELRD